MRTTIRLLDALLDAAKKYAATTGATLTAVIEAALREKLLRDERQRPRPKRVRLKAGGADGLLPGIDLDDSATLIGRWLGHVLEDWCPPYLGYRL
jgi:hypothetical protein